MTQNFVKQTLIRDTVTTTFWSGIGKAAGLLVPFFIAAWFGSTRKTDAFFFCFTWISGFSIIFSTALESVIVPFIAQIRSAGENVGGFVGRVILRGNLVLLLTAVVFFTALAFLLPFITRFSPGELGLVRALLFETAPLIILIINSSVLAGLLNAYRRFALPAVSPAFRALVAIFFILILRSELGIHAIPIGYVLGEIVRLALLLIGVGGLGIKLDWKHGYRLGEFFAVAGRQVVGMLAIALIPIVDKTMASWLKEGSISNLFYAERFYQIPVVLLSGGMLVTLLSHWSGRVYSAQGGKSIQESFRKTLWVVGGIAVVLLLILNLFREHLVRLALDRDGFGRANLESVSLLYFILLFSLVPELISTVLTRVCIIYKQTTIIRNVGLLRLALKIVFNLILMNFWGVSGIAGATVLTMFLPLIYLWRKTLKIGR